METMECKENFFRNHTDTMAIIGVNIAIAAIILSLWILHESRIDSINSRMDSTIALIHQESKDFHGRLIAIEERNKK